LAGGVLASQEIKNQNIAPDTGAVKTGVADSARLSANQCNICCIAEEKAPDLSKHRGIFVKQH
jgi:precorrin isomerase